MSLSDLDQALLMRLDDYLTERDSALVAHLDAVTQRLAQDADERAQLERHISALARHVTALSRDLRTYAGQVAALTAQVQALQQAFKSG